MTSSPIIEAVANACYRRGCHPVDVAEALSVILIEDTLDVGVHDPRATLLARRVIGAMLDSGWEMPARAEETTP